MAGARVLEFTHTHSQPGFPGVEDEGKKRGTEGARGNKHSTAGTSQECTPVPRTLPIVTRNQEVSQVLKLPPETSAQEHFLSRLRAVFLHGQASGARFRVGPTLCLVFVVFETGSNYAAQAGLELAAILLSQLRERWNYRRRELPRSTVGATLAPPTPVSAAF